MESSISSVLSFATNSLTSWEEKNVMSRNDARQITIAADAAYQDASGGEPRGNDIPWRRIEDIRRIGDVLQNISGVDPDRIGVLGICGGGGYTIGAASTDRRFRAVATLSAFNTGIVRRDGYVATAADTMEERLQTADARTESVLTGQTVYPGPSSSSGPMFDLYTEGGEYYGNTHFHPNAEAANPSSNLIELASYDAADYAPLIAQPLLMIVGSRSEGLYLTLGAYEKALHAESRTLHLIEGASHLETYWVPEYVDEAVSVLEAFFAENL